MLTRDRARQVDLVDDGDICDFDLVLRQLRVQLVQFQQFTGVDDGDDGVQLRCLSQAGRHHYGHGRGLGVGHATGFHDDHFRAGRLCQELFQGFYQVIADTATDTAIGQADGFAFHPGNEFGINVYLPEIIHQHPDTPAMPAVKYAVQQCCFPGAEKTGYKADGYFIHPALPM